MVLIVNGPNAEPSSQKNCDVDTSDFGNEDTYGRNSLPPGIISSPITELDAKLPPEILPPAESEFEGPNELAENTFGVEELGEIGPLVHQLNRTPVRRFKILQQWEGVVTEVNSDTFQADIFDLTDPSKPQEVVELPLEEISEADRELIVPGGIFYWIIGYHVSTGGQKSRVSEIRVRRNPTWSKGQIEKLNARSKEIFEKLSENIPTQPR